MEKIKSCYIHIPFCSNICSYCDFCKFYYQEALVDRYLDALLIEIQEKYRGESLETIYIGGGTPSSLNLSQLEKLFTGLNILQRSISIEFTVECNILDLTIEKLQLFKKFGVNRLSIGIQSSHSELLSFLDRNYTKKEIITSLTLAKQYFSNINIDLIYAVPGETLKMLEEDLTFFLSLGVPHISAYSLMIEDHTKLGIQKVEPISEELDQLMYKTIQNILTEYNYYHYEISNYAFAGYESQHNQTYWRNEHYYGFGLGSSGYIDSIRYVNTKNMNKYLSGNYLYEQEKVTPSIDASNYAILGFRTLKGVNKKIFADKFHTDFKEYFQLEELVKDHIILETSDSYFLNPDYWYLSNEILVKFV